MMIIIIIIIIMIILVFLGEQKGNIEIRNQRDIIVSSIRVG
jgi:hypothetical protein